MEPHADHENYLRELEEKVDFFEKIINELPVIIFINEISPGGDFSTIKNIWSNKWALDFIGYPQEVITELGYDFVKLVYHEDDLEIAPQSLEISRRNNDRIFYSLSRQKPKDEDKYQWIYSRTKTFKTFPDGSPRQSLNVGFEIHNEVQTKNQVDSLIKEIMWLKNKIKLKSLTSREKEIMHLIAKGLTDKEISAKLHISIKTSKTHRNKIIKKLGLKNSACVAAMAVECGLH
jgi:DNA-binding CsgD family transcriptional regulator